MTNNTLSKLILGTALLSGTVVITGCDSPLDDVQQRQAQEKAATMKCAAGKCGAQMETNSSDDETSPTSVD